MKVGQPTEANGLENKEMAKVFRCGQMAQSMKVNGSIIKLKELELSRIKMVISLQDHGKEI